MSSGPRRRILAVVAFLSPALLGAMTAPASATFPGRNGEIAFARLTHPTVAVSLMSPNGTPLGILTSKTQVARDPAWSPDGHTIVWVGSIPHGPEELFTMSEEGKHAVRLTYNDRSEGWPSWSPDGRWITYVTAGDRGRTRIEEIRPDGSHRRRLTSFDAEAPDWSPDGSKIALDAGGQIQTMQPRGRSVQQVTAEGGYEPSWSPDGRWLVFVNAGDIFEIHPDGTQLKQLTSTGIEESWPSWSPNGERIVYLRTRANDERGFYMGAIWSIRADGSWQRRLMRRVSNEQIPLEAPDWQPSGGG